MPRIKTFAVSAHCRGRPGLHHETQKFETQVHARGNSCTILLTWSTIYIFSRFAHAKTHLNTFVPNCMDFSRSEIFQILGRIAPVLRASTPAILNLKVFIGTHYPARPLGALRPADSSACRHTHDELHQHWQQFRDHVQNPVRSQKCLPGRL